MGLDLRRIHTLKKIPWIDKSILAVINTFAGLSVWKFFFLNDKT